VPRYGSRLELVTATELQQKWLLEFAA